MRSLSPTKRIVFFFFLVVWGKGGCGWGDGGIVKEVADRIDKQLLVPDIILSRTKERRKEKESISMQNR